MGTNAKYWEMMEGGLGKTGEDPKRKKEG